MIARFPPTTDSNPYQHLLYGGLARLGCRLESSPDFTLGWMWRERRRVDLLHFHWRPDRLYGWPADYWLRPSRRSRRQASWISVSRFAARLAAARVLGYRLVWTIHEVYPYLSSGRLDRLGARALARASHLLIAHDVATAERARREIGRSVSRVEVVPHGSYVDVYPPGRPREEVRAELKIPPGAFAYLCFGQLRACKRLDVLLEAFARVSRPDAVLVVAGKVADGRVAELLQRAARSDARIRLRLGRVPDSQVAELFQACDAAVCPRGDGWTSGSLILALSLGRPVVAARRPAYADLLGGERSGWLFEPDDSESLARTLETAARDLDAARAKGAAGLRRARRLRWEDTAWRTAELLRPLVDREPRPSG